MLYISILALWLHSLWLLECQAINCYTPNGDDRNKQFGYAEGEDYIPCNAAANHSMCCAFGSVRISQGSADTCLDNGLCQNGGSTWRESCTDPTWQDPACLKLFVNGTGYGSDPIIYDGGSPITDVLVTECDNGSFCYGTGNRACCSLGQGVFLNAQGEQTDQDPTSTTSTTSSMSASSTASTSSDISSSSSTSSPAASQAGDNQSGPSTGAGGLSTGAKAGIGAGIGIAALATILLLGFLYLKRRKRRQFEQPMIQETPYYTEPKPRHIGPELQASGHGRDYRGPFTTAELESPPSTVKPDRSTVTSSSVGLS